VVFFPGPPVSSTNKTDRNDITEILLKVVLNTITLIRTLTDGNLIEMEANKLELQWGHYKKDLRMKPPRKKKER
jgi:hypothetical protein